MLHSWEGFLLSKRDKCCVRPCGLWYVVGDEQGDGSANEQQDAPLSQGLQQGGGSGGAPLSLDPQSGEQQHSLALAYYQGLTHAEVAEQMGHPLGTVKSWVRRGLQGLKNCLERASLALS